MTSVTKYTKRFISVLLSLLMLVSSVFATVPLVANAATKTTIENYWESGGKAHKHIHVNGEDAFCINFGGLASGTFQSTSAAQSYYANLTYSQRVAIDKIISYAYKQGYLNNEGTNRHIYYSGVQRAIWQITDRSASNNGLSTWFKNQTASVYNDIMNNYSSQISSADYLNIYAFNLTEDNNYSETRTYNNLNKWRVSSVPSGLNVSTSGNNLTVSSKNGYFTGTKTFTVSTKEPVYNFSKYYAGLLGQQYVLMTSGARMYLSEDTRVSASAPAYVAADPATITVTKKDYDTKEPISGVQFEVSYVDKDGHTVAIPKTTNASGVAIFEGLPVYRDESENNYHPTTKNVFTVTEVSPATDYLNVSEETSVTGITLSENETREVTLPGYNYWPNMKKLGDVKVIKNAEDKNGYVNGENFEFTLTSVETGASYSTTTDANGEAYFCNLPVGEYTLKEVDKNSYIPTKERTFFIDWDQNTSTENRNYSTDSSQFQESTTLVYGDELDDPIIDVIIPEYTESESSQSPSSYDDSVSCHLTIDLKDDLGAPIANAEFLLMDMNNVSYGTATTDENGLAYFYNLPGGKYRIKQQSTKEGYFIDTKNKFAYLGVNGETDVTIKFVNDQGITTDDSDTDPSAERKPSNIFTFYNTYKRGDLKINKSCEIFGSNPLIVEALRNPGQGFKFEVTSAGSENVTGYDLSYTVVTGADGTAALYNIPAGTYTIKEVDVADIYKVPPVQTVTVGWDNQTKYPQAGINAFDTQESEAQVDTLAVADFENLFSRYEVNGSKVDETGAPVVGAVFGIFSIDEDDFTPNTAFATSTTDTNGNFKFFNVPLGEYIVVELQAPTGYIINATPQTIKVTGKNDSYNLNFVNNSAKGQITIVKTGEKFVAFTSEDTEFGKKYTPIYQNVSLKGVIFEIYTNEDIYLPSGVLYKAAGELVEVAVTGEDGIAVSSELPLGSYSIVEKSTADGYMLDTTKYVVDLTYIDQNTPIVSEMIELTNARQKLHISLDKKMELDEKYGIGNKNEITDVKFGIFAAEDLIANNGEKIEKGSLLGIASADETGCVSFNVDVPYGYEYYVKELATNYQYVLSSEIYSVKFDNADDTVEWKTVYVQPTEESEVVPNSFYPESDHNYDSNENSLYSYQQDDADYIRITFSPLCEFEADKDYLYIYNAERELIGSYTGKELAGKVLLIAGQGFTMNLVSDAENEFYGFSIDKLEAIKGEPANENVNVTEYNINTQQGVEITNDIIRGKIVITKTDVSTGKVIPNCKVEILNSNKEVVVQGVTDKNGKVEFELPYGTYYYREYEAPEGYVLDTTPHEFTINEDGSVLKATMTNDPIIVKEVNTGRTIMPFTAITAVASLGLIVLLVTKLRKKEDE